MSLLDIIGGLIVMVIFYGGMSLLACVTEDWEKLFDRIRR